MRSAPIFSFMPRFDGLALAFFAPLQYNVKKRRA
jgi:hypothetical protein